MNFLFLFLLPFSIFANLTDNQIKFKYQSFDGQVFYKCTHKKVNEWYDWDVFCHDKKFSVHLSLKKHIRSIKPKTRFEILYWITNKSIPNNLEGTGTTIWFHLNEQTDYSSITLSQATEDDTAGLYLEINPL